MVMRAARKAGVPVPVETLKVWEKQMKKMDTLERERIYILTVAAEEGWKTASELSFSIKGNDADKHLAKVKNKLESKRRRLITKLLSTGVEKKGKEERSSERGI